MTCWKRLFLCLVALCLLVQGEKVDKIGHCYEKLALWEYYNIAFEWKGPAQRYIASQYKEGGQDRVGKAPDGRLLFQDFINIVGKRRPGGGKPGCSVEPPDPPKRDFKTVALELQKQDFDLALPIEEINKSWRDEWEKQQNGKKGGVAWKNKPKKGKRPNLSDADTDYVAFLQMLNEMVTEAAKDPEVRPKIEGHLKNLEDLSNRVKSIRQLELEERILTDVQREVKYGGLGLTKDQVVKNDQRTSPFSDAKYESLNVAATRKKLKTRDDRDKLKAWVEKYGKGKDENDEESKDRKKASKERGRETVDRPAMTHVKSLAVWFNQHSSMAKLIGKSCGEA